MFFEIVAELTEKDEYDTFTDPTRIEIIEADDITRAIIKFNAGYGEYYTISRACKINLLTPIEMLRKCKEFIGSSPGNRFIIEEIDNCLKFYEKYK